MPKGLQIPVYMIICALHGLSFGALYAPAQALMFGLDFRGTLMWIAAGFPFDFIHAISDFAAASLVIPLSMLLKKLHKNTR
jgi:energy-coupling factor transport system substrate-specific component